MKKNAGIWMPLYIGDYLADTMHLDAARHGCYLLWIMHYWKHGPLPNDLQELVSIGRLCGQDACSIAQALLEQFFFLNGDGRWHKARIDAEREKSLEKQKKAIEKAEKAANARWVNA